MTRDLGRRSSARADVWDASGGVCHYCKKALHPFRDFEVEHVIARCNGGSDERDNLVAACRDCNRQKLRDVDFPARALTREPQTRPSHERERRAEAQRLGQSEIRIRTDVLRQARERALMSRRELARACGLRYETINQLERGKRDHVYPATARVLCEALELAREELLSEHGVESAGGSAPA